jgi:acetylglutamate kinase
MIMDLPVTVSSLLVATAQARSMRGKPIVVKLGGSAMEEPRATRQVLESVVALQTMGVPIVLVHGGGKPIDRAMDAAGITPVKVQGRRYTDEATLNIVVKVLEELNTGLVRQLVELGGFAFKFPPTEEFPLRGRRLMLPGLDLQPIDLGYVGEVLEVDLDLLEEAQAIPVLPSLARDQDREGWLNVNADSVASAVAGALGADSVFFLTDTPGVLRNLADPTSLVRELSQAESEQLMEQGVIAGGMIPKVEACFEALTAGARRAVILDGRKPYALLQEFLGEPIPGTVIHR